MNKEIKNSIENAKKAMIHCQKNPLSLEKRCKQYEVTILNLVYLIEKIFKNEK